jgi:uncharacterized protein (UPF0332 family)
MSGDVAMPNQDDTPKSQDAADQSVPFISAEIGQRVMEQALEIWINPEIQRRLDAGLLAQPFELYAAQVVFYMGLPTEVRLNQEIKANVVARADRVMVPGETFTVNDVGSIIGLELTEDNPDAGHITLVHLGNGRWEMGFNFQYNRGKGKVLIEAAAELIESAKSALQRGHIRPFVDSLHSAVELAAKARLILIPDPRMVSTKKHEYVVSQFNKFGGKLGNAPGEHVGLFNELSATRSQAKYSTTTFTLEPEKAAEMMQTADQMVTAIRRMFEPLGATLNPVGEDFQST